MKWSIAIIVALVGIPLPVNADDAFIARLKQFEDRTKTKQRCGCDGPTDCACGKTEGECHCGPCTAAKAKRAALKAKVDAPPILYKHTCGCAYAGDSRCIVVAEVSPHQSASISHTRPVVPDLAPP